MEINETIQAYLDSKMTPETTSDDFGAFIDRVVRDPRSHADFAEVVRKVSARFHWQSTVALICWIALCILH